MLANSLHALLKPRCNPLGHIVYRAWIYRNKPGVLQYRRCGTQYAEGVCIVICHSSLLSEVIQAVHARHPCALPHCTQAAAISCTLPRCSGEIGSSPVMA